MLVQETINILRNLYGESLKRITVERIVIGVFFTGVKLSNGYAGISYTPVDDIHRYGSCGASRKKAFDHTSNRSFCGASVSDILTTGETTPILHTIRLVTINALSNLFFQGKLYSVIEDRDILDLVDFRSVRKVAMVGAIFPFLRQLKKMDHIEICVIEKKKDSLAPDELPFFVPPEKASMPLSVCDLAIITGATVANGTIGGILDTVNPHSATIIVGPTASFLPDAFFRRGVDIVSGVTVTEPDRTLDLLAEGSRAHRLFYSCVRKLNIVSPGFCSANTSLKKIVCC